MLTLQLHFSVYSIKWVNINLINLLLYAYIHTYMHTFIHLLTYLQHTHMFTYLHKHILHIHTHMHTTYTHIYTHNTHTASPATLWIYVPLHPGRCCPTTDKSVRPTGLQSAPHSTGHPASLSPQSLNPWCTSSLDMHGLTGD